MLDDNSKIQPVVELYNITKIFNKTNWAIKKISLTINRGDCLAIMGNNGSGKSVLGKLIGNQISQTSGTIDYFFEEDNIFRAIGYQGREQTWPGGFTVKDIYRLYSTIYNVRDQEWINKLMDTFEIQFIFHKTLSKLNIISLQLFAMFLAMLHKPELVIIDEFSATIGFETRFKIVNLLKEYTNDGGSVVVVYPDDFVLNSICNRIILLNNGEIEEDLKISEVINDFGSTFEFVKKSAERIKVNKYKKKIDPNLKSLINKYNSLYTDLNVKFQNLVINESDLKTKNLAVDIKNNLYYVNLSRELLIETFSVNLTSDSVKVAKINFIKTKKSLQKLLKKLNTYNSASATKFINLPIFLKSLINIDYFIENKIIHALEGDALLSLEESDDVDTSISDRKKLKSLKKKYIKEEMKIIKLERKKSKRRKQLEAMSIEKRDELKNQLINEQIKYENEINATSQEAVIDTLENDSKTLKENSSELENNKTQLLVDILQTKIEDNANKIKELEEIIEKENNVSEEIK
ncbi:ABC transporter ATP-binding protein [Williamsoniiplasma somnilux]|uniref:ABC transporter ATP-binding protein n=1 Tax=Williamsoniiplasma somnilux TaxID=215578 RepID=A0A2K8NXW9_9MOLU|nr:ATP-binding cassette domain-containing protein [Williamsoniiplasma somnilux]ATZ18669.1 ABC transporter ATP-binding protein [Williamsoniiplasma somnilux]